MDARLDDPARWQPFDPGALVAALRDFRAPWGVSGGWAVDLTLGQLTRAHSDTDVALLRRDQHRLRTLLSGWDLRYLRPGQGWRSWDGHRLDRPVERLRVRHRRGDPWLCELHLEEAAGAEWVYAADAAVRRPLEGLVDAAGEVPLLRVEIVLLYKAAQPSAADDHDLELLLPRLEAERREWLTAALRRAHPRSPWLDALAAVRSPQR